VGLTGLEPVTLRLSSACSNQLSYRPGIAAAPRNFRISIADFRFGTTGALRAHLLKSTIANRKSKMQYQEVRLCRGYGATAPNAFGAGGKGIRTPDFQLAKLALYQLSYAPIGSFEFRLPIFDCKEEKKNAGCRLSESTSGTRCFSYRFSVKRASPNTPLKRPYLDRQLYL
jgi:hypothetical protein